MQAEGGVWPLSVEYLQRVYKLCKKYGILLIVDDIQVGCGRTGEFFSFERAGIVPDILVLAKSIGGYGIPFSLTLFKPELDVFLPDEHNGTFRGNQISMVAAKSSLEYMLSNNILDEAKRKSIIVEKYLSKFLPKDSYRGIGLIWGVDLKNKTRCAEVANECFRRGLIIEKAGRDDSVLKIMPAITIPDDYLIQGMNIISDVMSKDNKSM